MTVLRTVAHDSGDGETIYHCPFCGGGQVTGRSDGTVECGYCQTHFTVQVQPSHPGMPQTIDGKPHENPEMPGQIDAAPELATQEENPFGGGGEVPGEEGAGGQVDPVTGDPWDDEQVNQNIDPVTGRPWDEEAEEEPSKEKEENPFTKGGN
jgi:hypothetical protein